MDRLVEMAIVAMVAAVVTASVVMAIGITWSLIADL